MPWWEALSLILDLLLPPLVTSATYRQVPGHREPAVVCAMRDPSGIVKMPAIATR